MRGTALFPKINCAFSFVLVWKWMFQSPKTSHRPPNGYNRGNCDGCVLQKAVLNRWVGNAQWRNITLSRPFNRQTEHMFNYFGRRRPRVARIILKLIVGKSCLGFGLDSTDSEQGLVSGCCEPGNEPSGSIKWGNFLTSWACCWLLKKDFAPWSWYHWKCLFGATAHVNTHRENVKLHVIPEYVVHNEKSVSQRIIRVHRGMNVR
jgi:hypothetical protein